MLNISAYDYLIVNYFGAYDKIAYLCTNKKQLTPKSRNGNMIMAIRSPKAKFRGEINFDEPRKGLGSVVSFTSDNIDELKEWAKPYAPCNVRIFENKKTYPLFDWQVVESYRIEK